MFEAILISGATYILTIMIENPGKREKILSFLDKTGGELKSFAQSVIKKGGDSDGTASDVPDEPEPDK